MDREGSPIVVLLEGQSDVAALEVLLATNAIGECAEVQLVDMGGVTNIRRHLDDLVGHGKTRRILGLCDAQEAPHFVRALSRHGLQIADPAEMATYGFHICHRDLEDELIRALGHERVLEVLARIGLAAGFAGFQQQLAWRDRPIELQLQRFAGVAAGRKATLAAALAEAVPIGQAPSPLQSLLHQIGMAIDEPGGPVIGAFPRVGR